MISRRAFIGNVAGLALMRQSVSRAGADAPFLFGLTPVFLTSDLVLLEALQTYLARGIGAEVRLVLRRTYQEITSQLVAGQIDAAGSAVIHSSLSSRSLHWSRSRSGAGAILISRT
jgi:phosphonate transport system substrate-binding protein